jgi:hypothetical protein
MLLFIDRFQMLRLSKTIKLDITLTDMMLRESY